MQSLKLNKLLNEMMADGVCLALSGGVDSALLLALLSKADGKLHAVTLTSALQGTCEIEAAKKLAADYNVPHTIIEIDVLSDEKVAQNSPERCYHCKKMLFSALVDFAKAKNLKWIADGTNSDDLLEYRPGLKALKELGVHSPLAETGLTKWETRQLAQSINLSIAKKPSSPCLATRLPYNTKITPEIIKKIEAAEDFIKSLGIDTVRVRTHNETARIELCREYFPLFLSKSGSVISKFKKLGYRYITLDLEGFRSGSMDADIIRILQ